MSSITLDEKVKELKLKGNECVKAGNFAESILHYTHAIKMDASIPQLYSNRSLAFLKIQQFFHALEDANEAIKLDPTWGKAHFRRAEAEYATQHYAEALISYRIASQLVPDSVVIESISRTNKALEKQLKYDKKIPWVGAGIGLIIGVLLIVADATLPKSSIFKHPVVQVVVTIAISLAGLGLGRGFKWYILSQRKALLEPPVDLFGRPPASKGQDVAEKEREEGEPNSQTEDKKTHSRFSKAQARQRYKKGKS